MRFNVEVLQRVCDLFAVLNSHASRSREDLVGLPYGFVDWLSLRVNSVQLHKSLLVELDLRYDRDVLELVPVRNQHKINFLALRSATNLCKRVVPQVLLIYCVEFPLGSFAEDRLSCVL